MGILLAYGMFAPFASRLKGVVEEEAKFTEVIRAAHRAKRKIGLCGQAPSDHPSYAKFLVNAGIDSMSVTPDSFVKVKLAVAAAERQMRRRKGRK